MNARTLITDPTYPVRVIRNRLRNRARHLSARVNETPIIIVGNQKSGTSAIAALLGEATGHTYTIDVFNRVSKHWDAMQRGEISFAELVDKARFWFSRDIVKEPAFTFMFDQVSTRFPQAKWVFVIRNPYDNIRSILDRVGLPGQTNLDYARQSAHVHSQAPAWTPIIDGSDLGRKDPSCIETLAFRWCIAVRTYLEKMQQFTLVRYETFLYDKVKTINELAATLGLPVQNAIEEIVDKQYQPKGNSDVDLINFFGHANIALINKTCASLLEPTGYSALAAE